MINVRTRVVILAISSASILTFAATASAQTVPPAQLPPPGVPPGANNPQNPGDEIIVTANKRAENINNVGMAITAATGAQLQQRGVTTVADLTKIEPSLQFSQSQSGTPVYTLRGVGYFEQSLSASPTVSLYQDEVSFPYPVMARGVLLDVERVEILKGPQGTLYGQNATGGAINFIAAKPTSHFSAGFDESFGRFNDNLLSGFISGPLSSTLSARLAGSIEQGGAWQKSVTRDDKLGDKNTKIARLIVDWNPSSNFKASMNVNGWRDRSETQAGQLEGYRLQAPQNISSGDITDPAFYLPAPIGSPAFNAYPVPIQTELSQPIPPDNDRAADWLAGTHPRNNEKFYQANLRLDYSFSDAFQITSLTNYEHFTESNRVDQAGLGVPAESTFITGHVSTFSQELRLHGIAAAGRFNWLLGANYESDKSAEEDDVDPFVSTSSYATAALGLPPFFQFGALNTDKIKTYSVFGNAEYHFGDALSVHGGIRYTRSDQKTTGCSFSTFPAITIIQNFVGAELASLFGGMSQPAEVGSCVTIGPPPNFIPGLQRNTLNQSNVPWRLGVDWKPARHTLLYVSVSKGYKAGSSPALGASQFFQLLPVTQEALLAYEAGLKSELLDRTLQLNLAVFHYDYTNKQELGRLQDPVFGSLQTLLNIPKSKEDGVEAAISWRPVHGLALNGSATYLHSKVTSDFNDFGPYPLGPDNRINFKGEPFPYTPKWSLQYGVRYDWRLWNGMGAFVSADGSYQTSANATFGAEEAAAQGAPPLKIKAYGLVNLTAGVTSSDDHWRAEIWGRNVTNAYYWTSVNYISDTTVKLTGLPATYGISLGYRY